MGKRESYAPGTFCWVDLATTDPTGAMDFYGEIFGWEKLLMEEDEELAYMVLRNAGSGNGGIMPMNERHGNAPPTG